MCKEMYGHPDAVRTQRPDGHFFVLTFLNGFISVKCSLINTKLWDFDNIGVFSLTMDQ